MTTVDTPSLNIFFSLLRSGLYGLPVPEAELPEAIDWPAVVGLARKHAVYGLIVDSVSRLPERLRPDALLMAGMNKFALGLIQANLVIDNTVARLSTFLADNGVDGVLLKGQGVARFYRSPQIRQNGDIDFYVGKDQYRRAVDLCVAHLHDPAKATEETPQHFGIMLGRVPVELHRVASQVYSPLRRGRFQRWLVDSLEHSPARRQVTIANAAVTLPSYDFDAIFIFYHAWRHYIMGGIGLRQLCDWTMIFHTHGDDIDTPALIGNIKRFGLTKGWKLFAWIAVNRLGLPAAKIPLYDPAYAPRALKALDKIITGGNFGRYTKANTRTPMHGSGLKHSLGKTRNVTEYFLSLFTLMPVEATFLFLDRLYHGILNTARRSRRRR